MKTIPTVKAIERGHARTGWVKQDGKYIVFLMKSKNYAEPGTVASDEIKDIEPIIGFELWGKEQARFMGMSFLLAAEQMEQADEERGGGNE